MATVDLAGVFVSAATPAPTVDVRQVSMTTPPARGPASIDVRAVLLTAPTSRVALLDRPASVGVGLPLDMLQFDAAATPPVLPHSARSIPTPLGALSFGAAPTSQVQEWTGTALRPLVLVGQWNGTVIVPLTIARVV